MKNRGFTNVFTAIQYPHGFHPIKVIKHFFCTWKWAWQRVTTGVCDMDTWDMNDFYLDLFINSLTLFKKKARSYPYNMTEEEWDAKINEMIDAFKNTRIDDNCNPYNEECYKEAEANFRKGLDLLAEYHNDLWW